MKDTDKYNGDRIPLTLLGEEQSRKIVDFIPKAYLGGVSLYDPKTGIVTSKEYKDAE